MPDLGKWDIWISIHALLAESDPQGEHTLYGRVHFYPRSPCGERLCDNTYTLGITDISIHALLAESDHPAPVPCGPNAYISIHALLAESDNTNIIILDEYQKEFLSTLSLRRATTANRTDPSAILDFYPRSPCGERPYYMQWDITDTVISIHALLAESDTSRLHKILADWDFYPRSPCGERPYGALKHVHQTEISIHALLAESDRTLEVTRNSDTDFYPRSPCGERQHQ